MATEHMVSLLYGAPLVGDRGTFGDGDRLNADGTLLLVNRCECWFVAATASMIERAESARVRPVDLSAAMATLLADACRNPMARFDTALFVRLGAKDAGLAVGDVGWFLLPWSY